MDRYEISVEGDGRLGCIRQARDHEPILDVTEGTLWCSDDVGCLRDVQELVRLANLGAELEQRVQTCGSAEVVALIIEIHQRNMRQKEKQIHEGSTAVELDDKPVLGVGDIVRYGNMVMTVEKVTSEPANNVHCVWWDGQRHVHARFCRDEVQLVEKENDATVVKQRDRKDKGKQP